MSIINDNGANVHKDHIAQQAIPIPHTAIIKASAKNIIIPRTDNVFDNGLDENALLEAKELKKRVSFQQLLEADDHKLQQSGSYTKCSCPFHPDRTPSFIIYQTDDYAKCYGCGWHGDIYKYEMEFHKVEFKKAWLRLNDFHFKNARSGRKAKALVKKEVVEQPALDDKQLAERKKYTERLATDKWIAGRICNKRFEQSGEKWKPQTLQKLAVEGFLGWASDALAFLYPTGTKYRKWPEKELKWEGFTSLWRSELLPAATHVYLTESETDAIVLINAGIEEKEGVVVVAAPSATTFKKEWAPQFKDKVVIFCYDNDEAGEHGVKTVAPLLQPYATKLRTVDLKEVA